MIVLLLLEAAPVHAEIVCIEVKSRTDVVVGEPAGRNNPVVGNAAGNQRQLTAAAWAP